MKKEKKLDLSNMSALLVLIVLCLFLSIVQPAFHSIANLINILQQVTVIAILALGVNIVIFTGGIDISVGSVVAICGIVLGKLVVEGGVPTIIGVLAILILGAALGTFNGVMISRFKLQPMIATLAMMSMARGAALTLSDGNTITGYSAGLRYLGSGTIPGTKIPVQIILMIVLFVIFWYVMKYRKFGRYIYSIGGNEEATRLSGINTVRVKTLAYTLSGFCASIAAVILTAKLNSAQPTAGQDYEMDAIASCVIGGTSLLGGTGSVWGTFVGAIIMIVIRNGLNLMNVSSNLQKLVIGVIILIAVLADAIRSGVIGGNKKMMGNNSKKIGALVVVVILVIGGIFRCTSSDSVETSGSGSSDGNIKIAYIVKAKSDEFWTTMEKGANDYAKENGYTLEFQAPEKETDVEKQSQMLQNAIVKGFDAIILSAADSTALIPDIISANNAGIPVILVNDTIDMDELEAQGGYVEIYVGISQYNAASQAGEYAAENIADGNVLYLEGVAGVQAHVDRLNGFKDQCSAFKVVASQTAKCDRNEAYNVTQNVLNANPDVNVIWATNAEMGQGAVQAIDQLHMTGKVSVFDFDASSDDLQAIEDGTLTGTIAQYPNIQAETAIDCAVAAINGEKLEANTVTQTDLITKDNIAEYKKKMGL